MIGSTRTTTADDDVEPAPDEEFDEYFRRLLPSVRRVAWRIVGDEPAAEDAAAEAFIRALVRWPKVRRHPNRDAWVLRVATNVALDAVRRQRRRGEAAPLDDAEVEAADAELSGPVLSLDVTDALLALPKRQREVVVLRYVTGLGEAEVADVLSVSINTVKTHGARGLAALRTSARLDLEGGIA